MPDACLCGTVVAVVVRVVMMGGAAHVGAMVVARAGEGCRRNQHQHEGSENKLFHGLRVAPDYVR